MSPLGDTMVSRGLMTKILLSSLQCIGQPHPLPTHSKQFSSVQFSRSVMSHTLRPHGPQHTRLPYPSPALSLLKLVSIGLVTPSNHLILCHPLLLLPSIFPSIRVFSNELALTSGGQRIGVSASTSVLPMNIQD